MPHQQPVGVVAFAAISHRNRRPSATHQTAPDQFHKDAAGFAGPRNAPSRPRSGPAAVAGQSSPEDRPVGLIWGRDIPTFPNVGVPCPRSAQHCRGPEVLDLPGDARERTRHFRGRPFPVASRNPAGRRRIHHCAPATSARLSRVQRPLPQNPARPLCMQRPLPEKPARPLCVQRPLPEKPARPLCTQRPSPGIPAAPLCSP